MLIACARRLPTMVVIYADGSCLDNGQPGARGGWGVHFPKLKHLDGCGALPGHSQTNNRAELYVSSSCVEVQCCNVTLQLTLSLTYALSIQAVLKALAISIENHLDSVHIKTDSANTVDVFTKRLRCWKKNGMRRSNGRPPADLDLIVAIQALMGQLDVTFRYVRGHSGEVGNTEADR